VDWTSVDADEQLLRIFTEMEIPLSILPDDLHAFAEEMQLAAGVPLHDVLKDIVNDLLAMSTLLGDIKLGDIIDEETYQNLIALNPALKEFFQT